MSIRRKGDRLAVWLDSSSSYNSVTSVGEMVEEMVGLDDTKTIKFIGHKPLASIGKHVFK